MVSAMTRLVPAALVFVAAFGGSFGPSHSGAAYAQCDQCGSSACSGGYGACGDGGCNSCGEAEKWSEEWYQRKAFDPVGARQKCHKGKLWPPYPRPTGEKQAFWHKFHSAHYWPLPYVCEDRAYVRNLSNMQIANGWINRNTLYDYHFDQETNTLNHAGILQLERILEDTPYQYRTVWVQKVRDAVASSVRMESVRAESITLVGDHDLAPIELRRAAPNGRPADEIDRIRKAELDTMPAPRILYIPVQAGVGGGI